MRLPSTGCKGLCPETVMTTTISWPARLPLPTYDGYALEPESAVTRTDMESGPARQRRRFT